MAYEFPFVTFCNSLPQAETEKVKRKIREVAKEDVEDKLLEACGYLGSYSDACRATVVDNFDAIYRCVLNPVGKCLRIREPLFKQVPSTHQRAGGVRRRRPL